MTTDLAKKEDVIAMQTATAEARSAEAPFSIDDLLVDQVPERQAPVLRAVPSSGESTLADAYLTGKITLTADSATIAQRVNNFRMAHARTESNGERVHKYGIGHKFGDLYMEFADSVTPDEFVELHNAVYDPFKGIFAEEAWDIQTRKLSHTKIDAKGRTYLIPFTEEETSAARQRLDVKRVAKLDDLLADVRFSRVHDKIVNYLAAQMRDEANDIPYVKNRTDKNQALKELISHICEAHKDAFEQMWAREHRYANYLYHIEEAVKSDLAQERQTSAHYKQRLPKRTGLMQNADRPIVFN